MKQQQRSRIVNPSCKHILELMKTIQEIFNN